MLLRYLAFEMPRFAVAANLLISGLQFFFMISINCTLGKRLYRLPFTIGKISKK